MFSPTPISLHRTTTGQRFIIVPSPRFTGCEVDAQGEPVAVIYPTGRDCPDTDLPLTRSYTDLRGLNIENVESFKPVFILYRLKDGTLLRASQEAIAKAGKDENWAGQYRPCLKHLIKDLTISEMPEIEQFQF